MGDGDTSSEPPRWVLPKQVEKERDGLRLSKPDLVRIGQAMKDYVDGKSVPNKDVKPLRDGVVELRVTIRGQEIRLYFSRIADEAILLGLHIHSKKRNNDRAAVSLAARRLKAYLQGEWG